MCVTKTQIGRGENKRDRRRENDEGQWPERKGRKRGEGSELSFSAPGADTFADTRHDHPLGVLRIFQWKLCVKGMPPRGSPIRIPTGLWRISDFGNGSIDRWGTFHPLAILEPSILFIFVRLFFLLYSALSFIEILGQYICVRI